MFPSRLTFRDLAAGVITSTLTVSTSRRNCSANNSSPSHNQVARGHGWEDHLKDDLGASESELVTVRDLFGCSLTRYPY